VYFVGILPLIVLASARRGLQETKRFQQEGHVGQRRPLIHIWKTPYRSRMLELGAIWFCTYVCTQNAVTFWKEFAVAERGFSDGRVGLSITIAALAAMPLVFLSGKLLDVAGRRVGALIIYSLTSLGVFLSYSLHGQVGLTFALTLGIFGASAVLPVVNAYTTELFPTDLRGDAFAWSNNLIGRIGYVAAPMVVGWYARDVGWSHAVRVTAIFPIVALALILWLLPETRDKELEETAAL
jgi:putative MFS transporter